MSGIDQAIQIEVTNELRQEYAAHGVTPLYPEATADNPGPDAGYSNQTHPHKALQSQSLDGMPDTIAIDASREMPRDKEEATNDPRHRLTCSLQAKLVHQNKLANKPSPFAVPTPRA